MAISFFKSGTTDALTWGTAGTLQAGAAYYKDVNLGTVAVGDLIVAVGASGGFASGGASSTRTVAVAPGSTAAISAGFTTIQPATSAATDSDVSAGRGVVTTAGTLIVRVAVRISVAASEMGVCAIRVPAAEWNSAGSFAVVLATNDADGGFSLAVPAQSTVFYFGNDWNAAAIPGTVVPTGSTNQDAYVVSGQYTIYAKTWTAQAAGTRTYGMSGSGLRVAGFALAIPEPTGGGSFTATAAITLPSITSAATASTTPPAFTGTVAATLPSLSSAVTATSTPPGFTGGIAQTLPSLTSAATASTTPPAFTGTVAATLPSLTQAATATRTVPAFTLTGANMLPSLTQSATAQALAPGVIATVAQTLPSLTSAATATRTVPAFSGTIVQTLPSLLSAAIAAFTAGATGPGVTVWNGTTEVPATLEGVWNGASVIPATIEGIL